jgi:hypothetical protein
MMNNINALLFRPTPGPSLRRRRTPHGGELLINILNNLKFSGFYILEYTFETATIDLPDGSNGLDTHTVRTESAPSSEMDCA